MMRVREVLIVMGLVAGLGGCERVQVVLEDDVPRHLCSRVLDNLEVSEWVGRETMMLKRQPRGFLWLRSWHS